MGGDLGESIPKGIDVGLCEALVKSKQPAFIPASLHGLAVASLTEARWPDLTGASAPETGHLADSMPEAGVEEYSLKLRKKCGPAKNPT